MLIDSHCHLDDERLANEIPQVLERARAVGVTRVVTIGTDEITSKAASDIARANPGIVFHTVGAHPMDADRLTEGQLSEIERLVRETKPVAIGEIGLDYHHGSSRPAQFRLFEHMLSLARQLSLPVVIHDRDAHDDLYSMLSQHAEGMRILLHCYSGGEGQVERFLALGCHFAFGGPVVFRNGREHRDALQKVPLERVLLETDAPWLAPDPHRGKRNEPAYVELVARKASEVKGIPFEDLARLTTANACSFFGLPPA